LGLVATTADPQDRRRLTVALTDEGAQLYRSRIETALQVSRDTQAPLSAEEQAALMTLLSRLT
jgi:DNA-binding MarR family transcriptional regulator